MAGAPRGNAVFTIVVTVLVLLCAVPMSLVVGVSSAPRVTVLAALLAAVPVGPLIACLLWLDRYEPEPRRLLVGGLLWGVFVATAIALLVEGVGGFVGGISDTRMLEIGAPVAEEASKGLFLLLLLWWRRAELDGVQRGEHTLGCRPAQVLEVGVDACLDRWAVHVMLQPLPVEAESLRGSMRSTIEKGRMVRPEDRKGRHTK